jgi:hypothetical protein
MLDNFYDLREGFDKGPQKVIFLDMDGVLCTHRAGIATNDEGLMRAIDPLGVGMINRLQDELGEQIGIVVSSTWRNLGKTMPVLLQSIGLRLPTMTNWRTPTLGKERGYEIQDWLDHHPHIQSYVILDDDSDMLEHQKPFHVHTDTYNGISMANYYQALNIFGIDKQMEVFDPYDNWN